MSSRKRLGEAVVCFAFWTLPGCSSEQPALLAAAGSPAASAGTTSAGAPGASGAASTGGGSGSSATAGNAAAGAGSAGAPLSSGDDLFGHDLPGERGPFDSAPHALRPTSLWGQLQRPLPTNAWWQNLVLGQGESPVNVLPYLVAATSAGLRVCHPKQVVEPNYTFSVLTDDVVLASVEGFTSRSVAAHDALSVTLEWRGEAGTMHTPLVEGMPYVSARFRGLRPRLSSAHAIASVNGGSSPTFDAATFEVALNNGQTWRVYSSRPLGWRWDGQSLQTNEPFDGWLRVAVSGGPELNTLLDEHAASVPTGGVVHATATGDSAALTFEWQAEGEGEPLLMALPHHLPTLKSTVTNATLPTIRGPMRAVVGKQWRFEEPLTTVAWQAPRGIPAPRRDAISSALRADAQALRPTSEEPYFFGKQLSAVARLALIADELGEDSLAAELRTKLKGWLEPWLAGGASSRLVYDESWGGLVSKPGIADASADFGLGYYNDHHFQFGYFVYAAAVIARKDAEWAASRRGAVEVILRDYASPRADQQFPAYRCKDWFVGHSWAAGVFEFADSRNQESTSEAINGYYAVYLWGLALGDARLRDLGRLLLATEIRSSQTYWQVKDDSIYPAPFSAHKIVGVLWATKADHTTWFGSQLEFIHGIQWMPFTPISEELLPRDWIAQTYPLVSAALTRAEPSMGEGWRGLVHMAHAIVDADAAWNEVSALRTFDDGSSRANALYWVATRP